MHKGNHYFERYIIGNESVSREIILKGGGCKILYINSIAMNVRQMPPNPIGPHSIPCTKQNKIAKKNVIGLGLVKQNAVMSYSILGIFLYPDA